MFYLTMHSTHFIYFYMASDIWLRTILIVRKETCCRHIGYSFQLTARVLLYAPSHRQDSTYHSICYTSRGALAGTINMTAWMHSWEKTQLNGNVLSVCYYLSVCHDDVMNLGNGLLCNDGDWLSQTWVVFQTLPFFLTMHTKFNLFMR